MLYIVISLCAFLAALLTFFSGFGLGTLLMPIIAIYFPLSVAITVTAIVHLLNGLLKVFLLRKNICSRVVVRFGIPAIIAAIPGAWLLSYLSSLTPIASYSFMGVLATVTPAKVIIGILLVVFTTVEYIGLHKNLSIISSKPLLVGGIASGFFGGLSGQQGALRSLFLLRANLSKEQFVGTNAAIGVLVDVVRLSIYGLTIRHLFDSENYLMPFLLATIFAFAGSVTGSLFLRKITYTFMQTMITALLYILGVLIIAGII